jgi:NAD-dependent deacetylase
MSVTFATARKVVVLTGAGVSVASGLPTYRGLAGLWTARPELARALVAGAPPPVVWEALVPLRAKLATVAPNEAHRAIARWERSVERRGGIFTLVTQNVDGLHQAAGSRNVLELHGALRRSRCSRCDLPPFEDPSAPPRPPPCPRCGAPLRPDVVLFEEPIGAREEVESKRALREVDLFVAVGTSGTVWPASSFVRAAEYAGARTILVNAERIDRAPYDEQIVGPAEEILPTLLPADLD